LNGKNIWSVRVPHPAVQYRGKGPGSKTTLCSTSNGEGIEWAVNANHHWLLGHLKSSKDLGQSVM